MRHPTMPAIPAAALTVVLLVAAGCGAGPGPATRPPAPGTPTTPVATLPPRPSPTEVPPTDPPATDDVPARPDPAAFLQVCWAVEGDPATTTIACEDAVLAALAAPDVRLAAVTRVDVRTTAADPDVATVTVLADGEAHELELTLAADGTLAVTATAPVEAPSPIAFIPPAPARADLPDAPPGLATRTPYPLCGEEEAPMGGPYDEAARRCFLDGVLAGSPVELASVGGGTEGQAHVTLYRYAGSGGLEVVSADGGQWLRTFTGIGEAGGGLVFDPAGLATRREPVP